MSMTELQKFSSQASPDVLEQLRRIAKVEGREFQAVLDEAMREYIERKAGERPSRRVLMHLSESVEEFDELYRELAK